MGGCPGGGGGAETATSEESCPTRCVKVIGWVAVVGEIGKTLVASGADSLRANGLLAAAHETVPLESRGPFSTVRK